MTLHHFRHEGSSKWNSQSQTISMVVAWIGYEQDFEACSVVMDYNPIIVAKMLEFLIFKRNPGFCVFCIFSQMLEGIGFFTFISILTLKKLYRRFPCTCGFSACNTSPMRYPIFATLLTLMDYMGMPCSCTQNGMKSQFTSYTVSSASRFASWQWDPQHTKGHRHIFQSQWPGH